MAQSSKLGQLAAEPFDDYPYYRPYYPHLEDAPKRYFNMNMGPTSPHGPIIALAQAHGELIYKKFEHCSTDTSGHSDSGELQVTEYLVPMHIFERHMADWYGSGKRNAMEEIMRIFPKTWTALDLEEGEYARKRVWLDDEFLEALRRNESMEQAKPVIVVAVFKYACERLREEENKQSKHLDHDADLYASLKEDCLREWVAPDHQPLTEDITLGSLATLSSPSPATWWRFHRFFEFANGLAVTTVFSTDPMPEGYAYVPFTNWFIDGQTYWITEYEWCEVFDSETDEWQSHYETTGSYQERQDLPKKQYCLVKDPETRVYLGARVPLHIHEKVLHEFEATGIRELGDLILELFPKSATIEKKGHRAFEECWKEISQSQWYLQGYHSDALDEGHPKSVPGDSASPLENFLAAQGPKGVSARDTVILAVYSWCLDKIYLYYYQYELVKPGLSQYVAETEELLLEWGFTGRMPSLTELATARASCPNSDDRFLSTDVEAALVRDKRDNELAEARLAARLAMQQIEDSER
ncbi:hypothetical protein F5Y18DRAFT_424106 [Xylariaceae sp. FL1019]|nr:hypothetical protein F5Y18DRAFT_424106 [Xylariaceae sp. FL1019]